MRELCVKRFVNSAIFVGTFWGPLFMGHLVVDEPRQHNPVSSLACSVETNMYDSVDLIKHCN